MVFPDDETFAVIWSGQNADNYDTSDGLLMYFFDSGGNMNGPKYIVNQGFEYGRYIFIFLITMSSQLNFTVTKVTSDSFVVIWRDYYKNKNYYKAYKKDQTELKATTELDFDILG